MHTNQTLNLYKNKLKAKKKKKRKKEKKKKSQNTVSAKSWNS